MKWWWILGDGKLVFSGGATESARRLGIGDPPPAP